MEARLESQYLLANEDNPESDDVGKNVEEPTAAPTKTSFWSELDLKQKLTFIYAAAGVMMIYFTQGIPEPFLSRVVVSKGLNKLFAAAIIHITYLSGSIASLICGKSQTTIPTRKFVWTGQLILGATQGSFGFLQYIQNEYVFLSLGFLIKTIQGVGQGFFNVATLTLLWQVAPDHVQKSFAMTRVMAGVGFLTSPILGGYLYTIQNDILIPFTVSAIVPLLLAVIGWFIIPDVDNAEEREQYDTWSYICNPRSVIPLGLASTCGAVFAVYDASFTSYVKTMGISIATVGTMFSVAEIFTTVTSFVCGCFANIKSTYRKIFILLCFIGVFGINFAFTDNQTATLLYIEASTFTTFAAVVQTFAFPEMIYQAVGDQEHRQNDFSFRSKLSGVWYFFMTLSMFVFGVIGTGIQTIFSYSMSLTLSTLVGFLITLASSVSIRWYRECL